MKGMLRVCQPTRIFACETWLLHHFVRRMDQHDGLFQFSLVSLPSRCPIDSATSEPVDRNKDVAGPGTCIGC